MDEIFIKRKADSVLNEAGMGLFPDDYLQKDSNYREIEIPQGRDVFLYRETEGVNLVIDGNKIYFNERHMAKYFFYCAVIGHKRIRVPDVLESGEVLKRFESDLQRASSIIMDLRKKMFIQDFYKMQEMLESANPSYKIIFYEWND